jgi:hypothetical protein
MRRSARILIVSVAVFLALGLIAFSARAQTPQLTRDLIISDDRVTIREFPHVQAPILATLLKGTVVYEVRRIERWVEVRGERERIGWLEASKVSAGNRYEPSTATQTAAISTDAIVALIVQQNRSAYHSTGHPCACPDDKMGNGRRCGGSSAYSRPGGASPKCYPGDVSAADIEEYRARNN